MKHLQIPVSFLLFDFINISINSTSADTLIMIALTMPLVILLLMSSGHVYGYPPVPLCVMLTNGWPVWKTSLETLPVATDNYQQHRHPSSKEINDKDPTYPGQPEKRLIDF